MSVEAGKRTGEPSNPMGGAGGKTRWKNPMWGSSKAPPEDVEKPKTKTQKFSGGTLPSDRGKQIPGGESVLSPGRQKSKQIKEENKMAENNNTMFIGVAQIQRDWGISRSKAYQIIKDLNAELKKKNPGALVVSGRVNRFWYEEACLQRGTGNGNG